MTTQSPNGGVRSRFLSQKTPAIISFPFFVHKATGSGEST